MHLRPNAEVIFARALRTRRQYSTRRFRASRPIQVSRLAAPRSRDLGADGLSDTSIRKRLKSLYVELDGGERFTPHSARATVATLLLDGGTDLAKVQELLGHTRV